MAATIKQLKQQNRGNYPWAKWTDGNPRRARKGKDFKCTPTGFAATLYTHADRNDLEVKVSVKGDAVDFQFSKPSATNGRKALASK